MTITVSRQFNGISAGTPTVATNYHTPAIAPLMVEFIADISGCSFDTTDVHDPLFPAEDYTGKTHDPTAHRLLYLWDFDDDITDWDAPENIPAEYAKRSKALGKKVMHIYTSAQTVNWKLEIWEPSSGKKAFASGSISVLDPLEEAEKIVLVNPNGDGDFTFTNPGSATVVNITLASGNAFGDGVAAFDDHEGDDNVCWLFRTDATYNIQAKSKGVGENPYFGSYSNGVGNASVLPVTSALNAFTTSTGAAGWDKCVRVQGIDFDGGWNTFDSVAVPDGGGATLRLQEGWNMVVADCIIQNQAGMAVLSGQTETGPDIIALGIANTVLNNIGGGQYGILLGNSALTEESRLCFVGNRYTDEVTLISGPSQSSTNGFHRALIRANTPTHMHIRGSDFFRLAGGDGQPIMKLNKASRHGPYMAVQFCVGEASANFVNFVEDKTGQPVSVSDAGICECCIFLHLPEGQRFAGATSTSNTVRSCFLVSGSWTDKNLSQGDATYRTRGFFLPGGDGVYPTGNEAPNEAYNNTIVSLRTQAQNANKLVAAADSQASTAETTLVIGGEPQVYRGANSIVHCPNQTGGDAAVFYAPLKDDQTLEADGITRPDGTKMRFRFVGWNPAGTPDATCCNQVEMSLLPQSRNVPPGR